MKKRIKIVCHALAAVVLLIALPSGAHTQPLINVKQTQFQLPVLIEKRDNPVIRVSIAVAQNAPVQVLQEITFSTAGSSLLSDISKARVYFTGTDSSAGTFGTFNKASLFAETSQVTPGIRFTGSQRLTSGTNYLWLSYEVKKKAAMMHVVDASCVSLVVTGQIVKVPAEAGNIKQRIGLAVRVQGQDGIHTHRIPGITTTKNGTLLATYDARRESSRDLQGNIDIGVSRSTDGGNSWEKIRLGLDMGAWGGLPEKFNGVSDANILVDDRTGTIFLAGLWMHGVLDQQGKWIENLADSSKAWNHQWREKGSQPGFGVKQTSQFMLAKSTDDGKTWSEPVNLTKMCKKEKWWLWAPAPGHGITMTDGTLVFPTQGRDENGRPFSNITYSKDGGNTWKTSAAADTGSTTENMAVQLHNGSLMLNMRANDNKFKTGAGNGRAIAITDDLGTTWKMHPTSRNALPEPVCMASIHKHNYIEKGKKKSILLFVNPNSTTKRNHITLKVSFDDGMTWPRKNWVLLDQWDGRGYSCITSIDNNTVGIVYESSMADLVFQKFTLNELIK